MDTKIHITRTNIQEWDEQLHQLELGNLPSIRLKQGKKEVLLSLNPESERYSTYQKQSGRLNLKLSPNDCAVIREFLRIAMGEALSPVDHQDIQLYNGEGDSIYLIVQLHDDLVRGPKLAGK